jgi:hypothetical protein
MEKPADTEARLPPRLRNELATITAMIDIFCRAHHQRPLGNLCDECRKLVRYAGKRLAHCPFQEDKPTCGNCPVHCYSPRYRHQIRAVMRYAGPRMIWSHPIMALRHLIDGRRKAPVSGRRQTGTRREEHDGAASGVETPDAEG